MVLGCRRACRLKTGLLPSECPRHCGNLVVRSKGCIASFFVQHPAHEFICQDVLKVIQHDHIALCAAHDLDDLRCLVGHKDVSVRRLFLVEIGPASSAERQWLFHGRISSVCAGSGFHQACCLASTGLAENHGRLMTYNPRILLQIRRECMQAHTVAACGFVLMSYWHLKGCREGPARLVCRAAVCLRLLRSGGRRLIPSPDIAPADAFTISCTRLSNCSRMSVRSSACRDAISAATWGLKSSARRTHQHFLDHGICGHHTGKKTIFLLQSIPGRTSFSCTYFVFSKSGWLETPQRTCRCIAYRFVELHGGFQSASLNALRTFKTLFG